MKSMPHLWAPAFALAFTACGTSAPPPSAVEAAPAAPVAAAPAAAPVGTAPAKPATSPAPRVAVQEAPRRPVAAAPRPPAIAQARPPQASAPAKAPAPATANAPASPPAGASPPLDLKSLEERLKETHAIGVLTKLSLKNQVDDLVARFRAYHAGERPPTLPELRPAFDLLLMKVLSLLQDGDPPLAHDINASRDAIWGVLADKRKLEQFT
jgi:hypothetical protein